MTTKSFFDIFVFHYLLSIRYLWHVFNSLFTCQTNAKSIPLRDQLINMNRNLCVCSNTFTNTAHGSSTWQETERRRRESSCYHFFFFPIMTLCTLTQSNSQYHISFAEHKHERAASWTAPTHLSKINRSVARNSLVCIAVNQARWV